MKTHAAALVLVFVALLPPNMHLAMAKLIYVVGGGGAGWSFAPYASYYSNWAARNDIFPGDMLSFKYDPEEHNVVQVNASNYAICKTSNPIREYKSGDDVVPLPRPGTYYFICGFENHCSEAGMLMEVSVVNRPGYPPFVDPHVLPPPHSPPPPPPHSPPPPPPHSPPPPPHYSRPPPPHYPPPLPHHPPPPPPLPSLPPIMPPSSSSSSSPSSSLSSSPSSPPSSSPLNSPFSSPASSPLVPLPPPTTSFPPPPPPLPPSTLPSPLPPPPQSPLPPPPLKRASYIV